MPDHTPNHGFQLWQNGEGNWEHRTDFERIDERLELRGSVESDRPDTAPDGTKFLAISGEARGATYVHRDGDWHRVPGEPPVDGSGTTPDAEIYRSFEREGTLYCTSAAEMNDALRALEERGRGGRVRWVPGSYDRTDFTEQVRIPPTIDQLVLDMRNVEIHISKHATYVDGGTDELAADSDADDPDERAFFYKPPHPDADDGGSTSVTVLGPRPFSLSHLYVDESGEPRPHVFKLWDTRRNRIAPTISAECADRLLYLPQRASCGHHTTTWGLKTWGGQVAVQLGDADTDCGKDRCQIYGQIDGFYDTAVRLENGLKNRIWAQVERPAEEADRDVVGYFIGEDAPTNSLMMNHRLDFGHPIDIRATAAGIYSPGHSDFEDSRLGLRPSNVFVPNYKYESWDFGTTDYTPLIDVREPDGGSVSYEAGFGAVELEGDGEEWAELRTHGPVGHLENHIHAFAEMHVTGGDVEDGYSSKRLQFGPYVDESNYCVLGYDAQPDAPETDRPLRVEIASGGSELEDTVLNHRPKRTPEDWILYVREHYQCMMVGTEIVYESDFDLSDWPSDPVLRLASEDEPIWCRRVEHGYIKRYARQFWDSDSERRA